MIVKFVSLIAAFFMLFQFAFPKEAKPRQSGALLQEDMPESTDTRTSDKIDGVDGSVFYIERPAGSLQTINAAQFGMGASAEDNFPALLRAMDYCKTNPGTRLKIDGGTYYLDNKTANTLDGLHDILIEGDEDTRLVFSDIKVGFELHGCDCVELRSIKFDWDWEKNPLSDIAVVANADPTNNTMDLVFPELENADENMIIAALTQCDPETLTFGAKWSCNEDYVYQHPEIIRSVTKVDRNILRIAHDGSFKRFQNGETYILRHYVYNTNFAVLSGESRNITFDNISLFGYPGCGFVVGDRSSHFQIINTYIGVEPEQKDVRHTSLGADAIHIANTKGCFCVANCDISGQGDDALNVHDGIGYISGINGNSITVVANSISLKQGDTVKFKDDAYQDTDITARIAAITPHADGHGYDITLTEDISDRIDLQYIVYSTSCDSGNYVIRNNYFHENRARGLLLQSSFGLCENNRFYKTEMQAIKIIMDIQPGFWYEGTGVDRLVIRNNVFDSCDYAATGEIITIGTNLAGKKATSMPFFNIEITDNTFREIPLGLLNADNVNGLTFSGNHIDCGTDMPKDVSCGSISIGKYTSNISIQNNDRKNSPFGGIIHAETLAQWAKLNAAER